MRLRRTGHAILRMNSLGITADEVEALIDQAVRTSIGETAVEYDANWRGMLLRIVVVREPEPARLITIHEVYGEQSGA